MGSKMGLEMEGSTNRLEITPRSDTSRQVLGQITREASEATGIPKGLPLVAAAADKACEVLGSGVFEPDVACLSYGTTATINTTHSKYIEVIPFFRLILQPSQNGITLKSRSIGLLDDKLVQTRIRLREVRIATERGVEPEILFDELVRAVPQVLRAGAPTLLVTRVAPSRA